MPNRTTSTAVYRSDLTGYFYENRARQNYLALQIMPEFEVPDKTGSFPVVPLEALLTPQEVRRAAGAEYHTSDHMMEDSTYAVKEYGHQMTLDDGERKVYEKKGNYDQLIAERLRTIILLKQEIRVKDVCHNTTTFAQSGNTGLAVQNEWDDATNAVPIDDIQAGIAGIRARGGPTDNLKLQVAYSTWIDLWRCDQIRDNIKHTSRVTTPERDDSGALAEMAAQLGVKEILVGEAYYNSANDGGTVSISDVWSNEYAFLFNAPMGNDLSEPCFARTMTWAQDGGLLHAEQYRDENRRSDKLRVRQWTQEKTFLTACAFLFSNITT
jgi:hypothetical protein